MSETKPKTIAVVGVTGNQGSSVARTFLDEPNWHVRGITRDTSKPSAQQWASQGVDPVAADLDDVESLKKAFSNADVIFGTTDFWQHLSSPSTMALAKEQGRTPNEVAFDKEVLQGKNIVDAAASALSTTGLERFVLSTCSDAKKWSKGEVQWVCHFDAKAAAVNYCREVYPDLWAKTSLLQLGYYASNWRGFSGRPEKQADGKGYKLRLPIHGDTKVPIGDAVADTGSFVKALITSPLPPGTHFIGAGSLISFNEWCAIFSKTNNVSCVFERLPDAEYEAALGPVYGLELGDMWRYFDKFGYTGGDPDVVYPWDFKGEVKWTTMEEYLGEVDWTEVL